MQKQTMVTLDPQMSERIARIQDINGLPFATICRSLINERLNQMFPEKTMQTKQKGVI